MTKFEIPGRPVPKQRPRVVKGHAYTPKETLEFEKHVALRYKIAGGKMLKGPVTVEITAMYQVPKSWSKKKKEAAEEQPHTQKPDLDNIIKSVLDGLNGVAWEDDAQVSCVIADKMWITGPARTLVYVEENG